MFEVVGKTTPKGRKVIVHNEPEGVAFNRIERRCGQCMACRKHKRLALTTRLVHESQYHRSSWFATATYDDEHLPYGESLNNDHPVKFMRSIRRAGRALKYFQTGEYGTLTDRPHYHFILYGLDVPDKRYLYSRTVETIHTPTYDLPIQNHYYTSDFLTDKWGKGRVELSPVSDVAMHYVTKYHTTQITGEAAPERYSKLVESTGEILQRDRESASWSNGLGKAFFEEHWQEIYTNDSVIFRGVEVPPPKYYDTLLERKDPALYEAVKQARIERPRDLLETTDARRLMAETFAENQFRHFTNGKL